jgi:nitroreductase
MTAKGEHRMHIDELLRRRSSIRAFRPDPVDGAVLERLVTGALQSPSWSNTQPYRLALATGAECATQRRDLLAAATSAVPSGEYPLLFDYPPPLQARRRARPSLLHWRQPLASARRPVWMTNRG